MARRSPRRDVLRAALSWRSILYYGAPVWALVLTFLVVSLLLILIDVSPSDAYRALYEGAFGSRYAVGQSLTRAVPLIFTALAFLVSFRCGLFNLGAEGQLQVGGLVAAAVGVHTGSPLLAIAGAVLAGGAYGAVPGYLKARLGVNEIISTLMLNFIAITGVVVIVLGRFSDPLATYPTSPAVQDDARLPIILTGSPLHAGLIVAVVVTIGVAYLLSRTPIGMRIRAVGLNPIAARHAGMSILLTTVFVTTLAGAIAGLAGAIEVLGVQYRVASDWSALWGFTGIPIAFLAAMRPLAVLPVAILYGALEAGAQTMQITTGIPGALVLVVQALPVLFLVAIWGAVKPEKLHRALPDDEASTFEPDQLRPETQHGYGLTEELSS